jgi:magnesium transporter
MQSKPQRGHYDEPVLQHARDDFVRISANCTVAEALDQVRSSRPAGRIVYFYVLDEDGRLTGVLPTRRLLLSEPGTPVATIMVKEVVTLSDQATLLDACECFILHRLLALPIVDHLGRMVGVVDVELYTDEISELARHEESDDVFQLIGVRRAEVQRASIPTVFGRRFPWLLCNIFGGLACALLGSQFEGVLQKVVALSLFIPVVLAIAESVSIQTLSLALQAHHGNRFRWGETLGALSREIPVGASLGLAAGLLIASAALIWKGDVLVGVTILGAITLAVTTAATLGLIVPTILLAAQRDPKLASGPIVLTLTDLATLLYYLGLATWLLS